MEQLTFSRLEASLDVPVSLPSGNPRLSVASPPTPFVAPTLILRATDSGDNARPVGTEVVFVAASAAVGKSRMASALSASRHAPLLNLADVPVSTGSLTALVSGLQAPQQPLTEFHAGRLPIIVDALDEGRLLSGETGFESFMETATELLLQDRSVRDRVKLVIFGRHDSVELARILVELHGSGVSVARLDVGYFDHGSALKLIDAYAVASAKPEAAFWQHREPARQLVEAYFSAIEAALGIPGGGLWEDSRGVAFAGYAPVLAALGSSLAEMVNFIEVANSLAETGANEAWAVIEKVLFSILDRERGKLCDKLATQVSVPVPAEAYDAHEQLRLLTKYVHGQPLDRGTRVSLTGAASAKYHDMIGQVLPEHPFVRQRDFGNAVLAAVVLAHAVTEDLLHGVDSRFLAQAARQPFLWRSLRKHLREDRLIDGTYLGYTLTSRANDPLAQGDRTVVRSSEPGAARVVVPDEGAAEHAFLTTLPVRLYGQVRGLDLEIDGVLVLEGLASHGTQAVFYSRGTTRLLCESVNVAADALSVEGRLWLEARVLDCPSRLDVRLKDGAQVWWGGAVAGRYPWNRFAPSLPSPHDVGGGDALSRFIDECCWRLPSGAALTLLPDFRSAEDDRIRWAERQSPTAFAGLIKLLVRAGLAKVGAMQASDTAKVKVRFDFAWTDLREALRSPGKPPEMAALLAEARPLFE